MVDEAQGRDIYSVTLLSGRNYERMASFQGDVEGGDRQTIVIVP